MSRQDNPERDGRPLHDIVDSAVAEAEERVRRRIGQGLHDDLQQQLYSLRVRIESARAQLPDTGDERMSAAMADLAEQADRTLAVVHRLARNLDRPVADQGDLGMALESLRDEMRDLHGLAVDIDRAETDMVVVPDVTAMLVRCVRELLFNVVKHAGTEHAAVAVDGDGRDLVVRVIDEGAGVTDAPKSAEPGRGLATIEARVAALGGEIDVSSVSGRGTTVTLRVPIRVDSAATSD